MVEWETQVGQIEEDSWEQTKVVVEVVKAIQPCDLMYLIVPSLITYMYVHAHDNLLC